MRLEFFFKKFIYFLNSYDLLKPARQKAIFRDFTSNWPLITVSTSEEKGLVHSTPQKTPYYKFYLFIQIVSSNLVVFSGILSITGFNIGLSSILTINSYLFFLFLLGTNVLIFIKRKGKMSFEAFLMVEVSLGVSIPMIIGNLFYYSQIPYYSEISIIFLGVLNLSLIFSNNLQESWLDVKLSRDTRALIIIAAIFLVLRFACFDESTLYLDDNFYFTGALGFTENEAIIAYDSGSHELPYPLGFPIYLGMFLKAGLSISSIPLKILIILVNTSVIFTTYCYLKMIIKERRNLFIFLLIITFNQWNFIEGPYLLPDTLYTFLIGSSFYFFTNAFLNKENGGRVTLIFGIITCISAYDIKPNGAVQVFAPIICFFIIFIAYYFKNMRNGNKNIKKIFANIKIPRVKKLWKYFAFMCITLAFVAIPHFVTYYLRNGITISEFVKFGLPYSLFNGGHEGQFTPVTGFSFSWFFEHFFYNFSYLINNFTVLIGYGHDLTFSMKLMKDSFNWVASITLFILFSISLVYFWLKHLKKNFVYAVYHFMLFATTFISLMLWGETYFMIQRNLVPLLILIVPPSYTLIKDLLKRLEKKKSLRINKERIFSIIFIPCLALVLFGSIGFFIPLMFRTMTLYQFGAWQFYGWEDFLNIII